MCSGSAGSTTTLGSLLGNGSSQSSSRSAVGSPVAVHSSTEGLLGGDFWVTNGCLVSSAAAGPARPTSNSVALATISRRVRTTAEPPRNRRDRFGPYRPCQAGMSRTRRSASFGRLIGSHTAALLCVHGAHVHGGGLHVQGVAIVPAHLLRSALGYDRVLSDAEVELLATTAWTSLRPA